jgi:hypothetical protein
MKIKHCFQIIEEILVVVLIDIAVLKQACRFVCISTNKNINPIMFAIFGFKPKSL